MPHIESGLINLIGATTENPGFEIITPLLSRSRVLSLKPLNTEEISKIIKNALEKVSPKTKIEPEALKLLAKISSGDARNALGNLELILNFEKNNITPEVIKNSIENSTSIYDKNGDSHYDTISAFIKSIRASDVDATGYYLAKMLNAGEDPKYIARRMIIFASEDIGLAGNGALSLANSAFDAVEKIGMPEAKYNLFHAAIALAKSKKSRETTGIMFQSYNLAKKAPNAPIPLHLRNSTSKITKELGYNKGYQWTAGFKHPEDNLPKEVRELISLDKQNKKILTGEWSPEIKELTE